MEARDLGLTEGDLDALYSAMGNRLVGDVTRERLAAVLSELLRLKTITLTVTAKHAIVAFAGPEGKPGAAFMVERSPQLD